METNNLFYYKNIAN